MTHAHGGLRFRWHRRIRFMTKKAGLLAPADRRDWLPSSPALTARGSRIERVRIIQLHHCIGGLRSPHYR